jgi:SM-20-related protein
MSTDLPNPNRNNKLHIDQKYFDEIRAYNNFLPEDLYGELFEAYNNQTLSYGWKSNRETDPHGHLNHDIARASQHSTYCVYNKINDIDRKVWDYIKENYPGFEDNILIRNYINVHTFGLDGYFHRDSRRQDETTIVIYLLNDWNYDWGGETVFINEADPPEIVKAVLPAKNSAVCFNANIRHCGRGVTRTCYLKRTVYVLKSRKRRTDNFEKLSQFLVENGANKYKHSGRGTLHDHLTRVYQILENRGFSEDVCFGGGLHSVFGTNIFKNVMLTEKDQQKIIDTFGEEATFLAKLFSIVNRPRLLEQHLGITENGKVKVELNNKTMATLSVDHYTKLQYIECANLIDQSSLTKEKYPNLRKMWDETQDIKTNK